MSLDRLRKAIRENRVSFPAQVPTFCRQKRPDIQWRLVHLFFVQQWSCSRLAPRYGLCPGYIRLIIRGWLRRAAMLGYVQEIPPVTPRIEEYPADPKPRSPASPHLQSTPWARLPLGGLVIDLQARTTGPTPGSPRLTRSEWTILEALAARVNRAVPHEDLVGLVSAPHRSGGVHRLRHFIANLRRKLEPQPAIPRYLLTEPAIGYRLSIPNTLLIVHNRGAVSPNSSLV
jgi:hypothetical protein